MLAELRGISDAVYDAVVYRMRTLGETREDAVAAVEASLRARGVTVTLHLSTTSPVAAFDGDNVAVYEVPA